MQTWPVEEQLDFLFRGWDQLVDSGWRPELTDELRAEFDRRLAAHEADPGDVLTRERVVERVRRQR
jgi:putative addiction module component (TIGR02574 family)